MTIDERIEALIARHEALTRNVEMMQAAQANLHETHEEMQKELSMVLRSQVLMSDSLDKLTGRLAALAEAHRLTEESQRQRSECIAALDEQSAKFRQRTDQTLAEITEKLNRL